MKFPFNRPLPARPLRLAGSLLVCFVLAQTGAALFAAPGKKNATRTDLECTMYYGGFAFSGAWETLAKRYPFTSVAYEQRRQSLDDTIRGYFKGAVDSGELSAVALSKNVTLRFGLITNRASSFVLALAQTEERVLREAIGGFHKLVVTLGFNLLVVDFDSLEIISSQPFFIEYIDSGPDAFSDADVENRILKMLSGDDSQLRAVLKKRLPLVRGPGKNRATLQVTSAPIGEKTLPFLPENLRENTALYSEWVGQQFSAMLAVDAEVAVLPFSKDGSNAAMSLVFADASRVQFKIPQPTYAITLEIPGFKKVPGKETAAERLWIYGAFLNISVKEPAFGKEYFSGQFKHALPQIYPASQRTVDDFFVASEALKGVFIETIAAMQKDKKFRAAVLEKCRL